MGFLDGLDETFAPGWTPNAGDIVQGIVLAVSSRTNEFGEYPILTLQRISGNPDALSDERVAVHCMAQTQQTFVDREHPAPGDRVAFRFNGVKDVKEKKQGRKSTYNDFSATIARGDDIPEELRIQGLPTGRSTTPHPHHEAADQARAVPPASPTAPVSTVGASPATPPPTPAGVDEDPW